MKYLITILLTLTALAGKQSRIANSVINEIKSLNSNHCKLVPAYEAECENDFQSLMIKKIKSFNARIINETFVSARKEENGKIKYETLLAKESITFPANSTSGQMKVIYNDTMKERQCVENSKDYLDSVSISYLPNDTCSDLVPMVQEKQCVDSLRLYLTDALVVFSQDNTCAELTVLRDDYIATL